MPSSISSVVFQDFGAVREEQQCSHLNMQDDMLQVSSGVLLPPLGLRLRRPCHESFLVLDSTHTQVQPGAAQTSDIGASTASSVRQQFRGPSMRSSFFFGLFDPVTDGSTAGLLENCWDGGHWKGEPGKVRLREMWKRHADFHKSTGGGGAGTFVGSGRSDGLLSQTACADKPEGWFENVGASRNGAAATSPDMQQQGRGNTCYWGNNVMRPGDFPQPLGAIPQAGAPQVKDDRLPDLDEDDQENYAADGPEPDIKNDANRRQIEKLMMSSNDENQDDAEDQQKLRLL